MISERLHRYALRSYMDELMTVCLHDGLSFAALFDKNSAKKLLRQWQIDNPDDLNNHIKWLLFGGGYNEEYRRIRNYLSAFTESDRKFYIESMPPHNPQQRRQTIVERSWNRLSNGGIAAFDCAWSIVLATAGSTLEWVIHDYKVAYSMEAVSRIKFSYNSWPEYVLGYTTGAEFSERFATENFAIKHAEFYQKLLRQWQMPLNRVKWDLPLGHI